MTTQLPMITCTPGVQGGYPCIKGTRTPVRAIVEYDRIYDGDTNEILADLPHLTREQIEAARAYYRDCPELVYEDIARQAEAIAKIHSGEWDHVIVGHSDSDRE
ncbi:hypothetical protein BH23CHL2_BH23CHL2_12610 [soil metagenome]